MPLLKLLKTCGSCVHWCTLYCQFHISNQKVTSIREYSLLLTLLYTFFLGVGGGKGGLNSESSLHTWFWDAVTSFCSMLLLETMCFCMNHNFCCFLKFFALLNIKCSKYLSSFQSLNFGKEPLLTTFLIIVFKLF